MDVHLLMSSAITHPLALLQDTATQSLASKWTGLHGSSEEKMRLQHSTATRPRRVANAGQESERPALIADPQRKQEWVFVTDMRPNPIVASRELFTSSFSSTDSLAANQRYLAVGWGSGKSVAVFSLPDAAGAPSRLVASGPVGMLTDVQFHPQKQVPWEEGGGGHMIHVAVSCRPL